MSVVILGMEIPKNGSVIAIYKLNGKFYASLHGTELCPIVPLPEKHGRLIDADDYAAEMKKRQDNAMSWKEKAARNNDMIIFTRGDQAIRTFSEAKLTLDNMETIVEAEGD